MNGMNHNSMGNMSGMNHNAMMNGNAMTSLGYENLAERRERSRTICSSSTR